MDYNQKRFLYFIPIIVFLLLISFLFYILQKKDENALKVRAPVAVGMSLPAIEYQNTSYNGTVYSGFKSSDLKKNDLSVINIWASWCTPCRAEHEILMKIKDLYIT